VTACLVRIDGDGLTVDGCGADLGAALARCRATGSARLVLAADAPTSACVELADALVHAGISVASVHRNGRRQAAPRYTRDGRTIVRDGQPIVTVTRADLGDQRFAISPYETDRLTEQIVDLLNGKRRRQGGATPTFRIFVLRTSPFNGPVRTRWFEADPPATWEDAKRRLVAAGVLDDRVTLPSEWVLTADPPLRVPTDRVRPLP